jgi:acetyl esterase/lipase
MSDIRLPRRQWLATSSAMACGLAYPASSQAADPVPETGLVEYPEHQNLLYLLDSDGKKQTIASVAQWETRRSHILRNMQVVMGPLPSKDRIVPREMTVIETVDDPAFTRKKIEYRTEASTTVRAWLFTPKRLRGKVAAVLCLHQTIGIGKDEPAGLGGNPNLHYALHLAQRGFVTLAPDYPSFGEYKYEFTDAAYKSGTMKAVWDNMRAVDLLQSLPEVDGERIGVIGHSLGGHNSMFTAAFDTRIKAIVSNCGFTRFHKYYGGALKGWTSARYMPAINSAYNNDPNLVPFDFPEIVGAFAPRAFLASAPVRDDNFEVSGVRDCMESARPVYDLFGKGERLQAQYPESAHDFPPEARQTAYRFLERGLS